MNRDLVILIFGRSLQAIILLISLKVSTMMLSPVDMGYLLLLLSLAGFFGLFLINPIGQYVNRMTHPWYEEKKINSRIVYFVFYLLLISFLSIILLYYLVRLNIISLPSEFYLGHTVLILALYVFFYSFSQTIISIFNMLEYRFTFIVLTNLSLLLALFSSIVLVLLYPQKSTISWFSGQLAGYLIISFLAIYYFNKKIEKGFDYREIIALFNWPSIKKILIFAIPISVGVVFLWIQTQSYRIIVEKWLGAEYLGFLGVGLAISVAITSSFESLVIQFLYPKLFKDMKNKDIFQRRFNDIVNLAIALYVLLAVFITAMSVFLTAVLVDTKFGESFVFVIIGAWIEFFRVLTNMFSTISFYKFKTSKIILPFFIGATVFLFSLTFSVQSEEFYYLVPLSLLLGSLATFLVMFYEMKKIVHFDVQLKPILKVAVSSPVFLGVMLLDIEAPSFLYSLFVVFIFGVYFLWVIYRLSIYSGNRYIDEKFER